MAGGSVSTTKIGPFRNTSGEFWDGKGHKHIVQIFVSHGRLIQYSMQYQYADENGRKLMLSELHGGVYGNKFDVVKLNYPKEYITCIKGSTNGMSNQYLCSITFGTNLGEYGPFGTINSVNDYQDYFNVKLGQNRQFYGFHGYATDFCLYSIGVYMKPNMTLNLLEKAEID